MFNWDKFVCQEKIDGSLVLIYYWNNQWYINTRGSFADGQIGSSPFTWDDLIRPLFNEEILNKHYTYVCEFVSPYNKIVKLYPQPALYLLTVFNRYNELEFDDYMVEADRCNFKLPNTYVVHNQEQLDELIERLSKLDKTNEGVVLRDDQNNRIKKKTLEYLALHRMANNGDPCHPKNLLPFIIAGELDELYAYFEEVKPYVEDMQKKIELEYKHMDNYWHCFKDEPSQKSLPWRSLLVDIKAYCLMLVSWVLSLASYSITWIIYLNCLR